MGKKIPLLISTLSLAASSLVPVTAWADESPQTMWTYAEMAALNAELETEINANCDAGDPMCRDSYIYNKSGDVYRALMNYRGHGLTVTAVDPYNHTIRVAYDASVLSPDLAQKLTFKDLYIVQTEEGYFGGRIDQVISGQDEDRAPHLKVLFFKNDADATDVWFPSGTEIELSTPELTMESLLIPRYTTAQKFPAQINVTYLMSNLSALWDDTLDFSDCVAYLGENMECQVRYEANKITYVAVEAPGRSTNPSSADNLTNGTVQNPDGTNSANGGDKGSVDTVKASTDINGTTSSNTVTTPNTGEAAASQDYSTEFPWWLGGIFTFGVATLVWFFWPKRKKSLKKC